MKKLAKSKLKPKTLGEFAKGRPVKVLCAVCNLPDGIREEVEKAVRGSIQDKGVIAQWLNEELGLAGRAKPRGFDRGRLYRHQVNHMK